MTALVDAFSNAAWIWSSEGVLCIVSSIDILGTLAIEVSREAAALRDLLNRTLNYLNREYIHLSQMIYNENGRYATFYGENKKLLDNYTFLKIFYNSLMSDPDFLNFGENKIIIVSAIVNDTWYPFRHNVTINNFTNFEDYWKLIEQHIETNDDLTEEEKTIFVAPGIMSGNTGN